MIATGTALCPRCGFHFDLPTILGGCPVCVARNLLEGLDPPEAGTAVLPSLPDIRLKARPLGHGGLGVVYQATVISTGHEVAVKLLKPERIHHLETAQRLRREGEVLEKLSHPNIVRLLSRGEMDGHVYLVMELVRGKDLRRLIRKRQIGSPAAALAIVLAVAQALEYAHSQGVLHLDIKPGNVLVTAEGLVKVADFGLARLVTPGCTDQRSFLRSDMAAGTRDYIAPETERLPRSQLDARADIFALGTLLYHTLTGELPHARPTPAATITGLPKSVDQIIAHARAMERDLRYPNVAEMLADLRTLQQESIRRPWWKWR